jgi:hypothetical protein
MQQMLVVPAGVDVPIVPETLYRIAERFDKRTCRQMTPLVTLLVRAD